MPKASLSQKASWTFLSNYGHVLLLIARDPEARMKDIAQAVGITERAVQRIIDDLSRERYLIVTRAGRRNRYELNADQPLRHKVEAHCTVGGLVRFVLGQRR